MPLGEGFHSSDCDASEPWLTPTCAPHWLEAPLSIPAAACALHHAAWGSDAALGALFVQASCLTMHNSALAATDIAVVGFLLPRFLYCSRPLSSSILSASLSQLLCGVFFLRLLNFCSLPCRPLPLIGPSIFCLSRQLHSCIRFPIVSVVPSATAPCHFLGDLHRTRHTPAACPCPQSASSGEFPNS